MKKGNKILMIIAIIVIMIGCKTAQVLPPKPVIIQEKMRVDARLVPIVTPADSANIRAYFRCDSLNNVIMSELAEAKSAHTQSDYSFKDGEFKYRAKAVHDTVYVTVVDTSLYKEIPVPYPIPGPEVNIITGWQWTQIYAGRLFLLGFLLFGVYRGLKSKSII